MVDVEIKASQTESRQWSGGGVVSRQDLTLSSVIMTAARNSFSIQIIIYNILRNIQTCTLHCTIYTL